jgi:hypothetical protein
MARGRRGQEKRRDPAQAAAVLPAFILFAAFYLYETDKNSRPCGCKNVGKVKAGLAGIWRRRNLY